MRAIILSDSHGDVRACMRAIEAMSPCDMIIHLGDIQRDVDFIKKEYPDIPVFSVMGNNELFFCGKTGRLPGGEENFSFAVDITLNFRV